jgi:DNA-binding beta-propeller fold protein YncE
MTPLEVTRHGSGREPGPHDDASAPRVMRSGGVTKGMARTMLVVVTAALAALAPPAVAAQKGGTRDVLVVSNNWAGTADLIDPHTFERLKRINVIPDAATRVAEIEADPVAKSYFDAIRLLVGEGHNQYVDDGFTSADGKVVYFSRPSFADVVAIDLGSEEIVWRTHVDGYRADHMAISEDGRRLLVSASTANVVDVIDTRSGAIIGRIPSGDSPHESNFSSDGQRIFHASIGFVYTAADHPSQDASKGKRVFEVIDANTLQVLKRIDMGQKLAEAGYPNMSAAVRPMAITKNDRYVYFQVSFFFGIVQYDLKTDRVVALLQLPLGDAVGLPRTAFLLDSAHHGLAFNPQTTKLCVAGTMSGYAAIVKRNPFRLERTTPVGHIPYWAASSEDGKYCFISVAGDDRVAVISFKTGLEIASIEVGDHPQRMRLGVIDVAALDASAATGATLERR